MKRKHYLLELFNGVSDRFILEAAESREIRRPVIRKKRMALIAAVLVLALLLMGCVAVFMGLQQRKIGELPVNRKFDAYGNTVPQAEKTWNIATMSGFAGSPAQQASQEWNAFLRTYKPVVDSNDPDLPDIPNQYEYTYQCWDQTMVDKLNEIAEKHGLQLLGTRAVAQSRQREAAFETLGITRLLREGIQAKGEYGACRVYPPHNFICDVRLTLTGEDAPWKEEVYCEVYYLQAGYLAPHDAFLYDPETTQEWEYTTQDGTKVLLALSETKGTVLTQREDSTIVIQMDLAWQQGAFLDEDTPLPTADAMERLADCFDYGITTQAAPMEGLQAQFDAIPDPNAAPPDDYEAPRYVSFAEFLNENYLWPELVEYAFHDIDGDGQKELITSYGDGYCINWLALRDGQVIDITGGRGAMRLCKNGIVESRDLATMHYLYYKIVAPDPVVGVKLESELSISHYGGVWKINDQICTPQEADQQMEQYEPLDLDWKRLLDFPMDAQGSSFGDLLLEEGSLTGEALLEFYADNYHADWGWDYSWFELRDINDDGIEDLLLSNDGTYIDGAYTWKRGRFITLGADFYLCRGNVMHFSDKVDRYNEGVLERNHFQKLTGQDVTFYYQLTHNLSEDIWKDTNYKVISLEEAQEILGEYSRVEMNMRPIEELLS